MRILGVDPGTHRTGLGVIEGRGSCYHLLHSEVLALDPKTPIADRLAIIYQKISEIIKAYQPSVLALENIFYGRDVRAMLKIGEARACAMIAASENGLKVVEYAPARAKQAVTGNGRATKEQIQHMVKRLLNLKEMPPPDSADALAIAICHLHCSKPLTPVPAR